MDQGSSIQKGSVYLKAPKIYSSSGDNHSIEDSPGSSIFDLPVTSTRQEQTPTLESRPPISFLQSSPQEYERTAYNPGDLSDTENPSFIVISGGTGCNSICSAFGDACYVLPVSDDGGSSSEIIRVLGGPSIGDIRSRLIRLIPTAPEDSPLDRIRNLLAYRLSPESSEREARDEWRDIVEGKSPLWAGIPTDRKEVIRGFLVYFENEILRRAHKNFSFQNGSVGNYFLAAAQIFFRSLPSAIFLFSSITNSQANIVPVLVTNHTVTIAAELENGRTLVGQCNISHPMQSESSFSFSLSNFDDADVESPRQPNFPQKNKTSNLSYSKSDESHEEPLEARINRLYYINAYGNEIHPIPNPEFLTQCSSKDVLVYSCGSLWTSIIPCLALKGVAAAIARSRTLKIKVLLLNSRNDRETAGYTASDYIHAIVHTLNTHYKSQNSYTSYPISAYITHLVYLEGGLVPLKEEEILKLGVRCIKIASSHEATSHNRGPVFDADCVRDALKVIMKDQHRGWGS